ncbi:MAG: hypothetical protein Q4B32_04570 [Clostridia bacterium]|nr:hypothetical protein [Clostridia bacterium]
MDKEDDVTMTAQIADEYKVSGKKYEIIAMSAPVTFDPSDYGFHPTAPHTACWRGYWCDYKVTSKQLMLDKLHIYCGDDCYPVFRGVTPQNDPVGGGSMKLYKGLNQLVDYDGSLVLGRGFINRYYIHMGFQRAWAYEEVKELVFEHGMVVRTVDHSDFVAALREQIDHDPKFMNDLQDNIIKFVHDSFSLDAKTKAWWI